MLQKLKKQMDFLYEVDKLKCIYRQSRIINDQRQENDAEHSWHLALMAFILAEHADQNINVLKVVKMLLIHDIVEIDAGDIGLYDKENKEEIQSKEREAANRIFGLLPEDQKEEMISLWEEFEAKDTDEAKFATILDRLQPAALNAKTKGYTWQLNDVPVAKVMGTLYETRYGSKAIWGYVRDIVDECFDKGYIKN